MSDIGWMEGTKGCVCPCITSKAKCPDDSAFSDIGNKWSGFILVRHFVQKSTLSLTLHASINGTSTKLHQTLFWTERTFVSLSARSLVHIGGNWHI